MKFSLCLKRLATVSFVAVISCLSINTSIYARMPEDVSDGTSPQIETEAELLPQKSETVDYSFSPAGIVQIPYKNESPSQDMYYPDIPHVKSVTEGICPVYKGKEIYNTWVYNNASSSYQYIFEEGYTVLKEIPRSPFAGVDLSAYGKVNVAITYPGIGNSSYDAYLEYSFRNEETEMIYLFSVPVGDASAMFLLPEGTYTVSIETNPFGIFPEGLVYANRIYVMRNGNHHIDTYASETNMGILMPIEEVGASGSKPGGEAAIIPPEEAETNTEGDSNTSLPYAEPLTIIQPVNNGNQQTIPGIGYQEDTKTVSIERNLGSGYLIPVIAISLLALVGLVSVIVLIFSIFKKKD